MNEAFGEEADLVELSKELHARGMVSLDVVCCLALLWLGADVWF